MPDRGDHSDDPPLAPAAGAYRQKAIGPPAGSNPFRRHCWRCKEETEMEVWARDPDGPTWIKCLQCAHYTRVNVKSTPSL